MCMHHATRSLFFLVKKKNNVNSKSTYFTIHCTLAAYGPNWDSAQGNTSTCDAGINHSVLAVKLHLCSPLNTCTITVISMWYMHVSVSNAWPRPAPLLVILGVTFTCSKNYYVFTYAKILSIKVGVTYYKRGSTCIYPPTGPDHQISLTQRLQSPKKRIVSPKY